MRFMPANHCGLRTGYLFGKYPGRMGHLFSPGDQKGPFHDLDGYEYALDNGAFKDGDAWTPEGWVKLLEWAKLSGLPPLWALVPDVVGSREGTLAKWDEYAPILRPYGWPLAFAVQDGMTAADVPTEAEVVFVGGSTDWKWSTYRMWCASFPRVHVGRVNSYRRLFDCDDAGAESSDGTGFNRGDQLQRRGLLAYLAQSSGEILRPMQMEMENCVHIS